MKKDDLGAIFYQLWGRNRKRFVALYGDFAQSLSRKINKM